ncbi:hypothetical protein [Methylomicrobium sp. Wu6]|uniref:hypothetical protein n=1 Tax=Methylomicrobium sp. Wu6 TaxID=3107928 RepID=UPI002DD628CD|nr:hypothetical protein [Methylomicrobium sp. Wu6]MEC4750360.1 hypothetical protein [Methylomicrobium sp. Wu6]
MSQDSINLKLVGFSEFEQQNIESVLSLAERGLLKKWRLVTDPPVDYYLLPESLCARMDQEDWLKALPRDRCIFSTKEGGNADRGRDDVWLLCDSRMVPRIRSMIELFNLLCEDTLTERRNQGPVLRTTESPPSNVAATAAVEVALAAGGGAFIAREGFVGQLLGAADKTGLLIYELNIPNSPGRIYVHPEQQVFYSPASLDLLAPFFTADQNLISCTTRSNVTEADLEQLSEAENLKPYTLRSLLWYGVFKSSQGRLLEGAAADKPVRLKRWPDLNLSDCQDLIKLAAFMQSNAAGLQTVADKTGIPINLIHDFYNACEIVGLIEQSSEADIHNKQLNPEKVSLFSKIRSRLNKAHPA